MQEARWWKQQQDGRLHCTLCPRDCRLGEGQSGFCYIRKNIGGRLYALGYGRPAALQVDPIEKKPLFHFCPGARILSMGTAGCNMGCLFCQNWDISKARSDQLHAVEFSPDAVIETAGKHDCKALAFTYNEPTIWAEYVIDVARLARQAGIRTVMVTNGYISDEALLDVYQYIDAANIDLKAFTEQFYSRFTLSHMEPVLRTLRRLRKETNVWLELTTLMIPSLNDSTEEIARLCDWVLENLGSDVPLHFTAFHPDFKLMDKPATKPESLAQARTLALRRGIRHAYEGNIQSDGLHTYCPTCGRLLIRRSWHSIEEYHLRGNRCPCGEPIGGHFPDSPGDVLKGTGWIERVRWH